MAGSSYSTLKRHHQANQIIEEEKSGGHEGLVSWTQSQKENQFHFHKKGPKLSFQTPKSRIMDTDQQPADESPDQDLPPDPSHPPSTAPPPCDSLLSCLVSLLPSSLCSLLPCPLPSYPPSLPSSPPVPVSLSFFLHSLYYTGRQTETDTLPSSIPWDIVTQILINTVHTQHTGEGEIETWRDYLDEYFIKDLCKITGVSYPEHFSYSQADRLKKELLKKIENVPNKPSIKIEDLKYTLLASQKFLYLQDDSILDDMAGYQTLLRGIKAYLQTLSFTPCRAPLFSSRWVYPAPSMPHPSPPLSLSVYPLSLYLSLSHLTFHPSSLLTKETPLSVQAYVSNHHLVSRTIRMREVRDRQTGKRVGGGIQLKGVVRLLAKEYRGKTQGRAGGHIQEGRDLETDFDAIGVYVYRDRYYFLEAEDDVDKYGHTISSLRLYFSANELYRASAPKNIKIVIKESLIYDSISDLALLFIFPIEKDPKPCVKDVIDEVEKIMFDSIEQFSESKVSSLLAQLTITDYSYITGDMKPLVCSSNHVKDLTLSTPLIELLESALTSTNNFKTGQTDPTLQSLFVLSFSNPSSELSLSDQSTILKSLFRQSFMNIDNKEGLVLSLDLQAFFNQITQNLKKDTSKLKKSKQKERGISGNKIEQKEAQSSDNQDDILEEEEDDDFYSEILLVENGNILLNESLPDASLSDIFLPDGQGLYRHSSTVGNVDLYQLYKN